MGELTKELGKRLLRDQQIYGPMLTPDEREQVAREQAELLVKTAKAEAELDEMLGESEK